VGPAAPHQRMRGMTLPQDYYTSDTLFQQDIERVYARSWLYAGHASQVREAGCYLTLELGTTNVIVVRDADGALHALHNVCRHRGARVCPEPCGKVKKALVCQYHGWTYRLDGSLATAPRMPEGFDRSRWGLKTAWVEEWQGLVYVALGPDPPTPVAETLAGIEADCAQFGIRDAKVAHTIVYDVAANWKLIMENYRECYHCQMNHPEFIGAIDIWEHEGSRRDQEARYHEAYSFADLPLKAGCRTQTLDGSYASAVLLGDYASRELPDRVVGLCWYPGNTMAWGPDYGTAFGLRPVAPNRTLVVSHWFVPGAAVEGVDYRLEDVIALWDVTNRQDFGLSELNQRGVESPAYEPGPYNLDMEDDVQHFVDAYLRMLSA
jgi:phenylpropionate dioxygenase-like ring-hydroxylating dioxygenase large terminal subunit